MQAVSTMIAIVNYGIGNLDSISRAFNQVTDDAVVTTRAEDIEAAHHIVLPGVGSFGKAMEFLRESGLIPALERKVLQEKTPVLGICLGYQMLTRHSEEGSAEGLGWIEGVTKRFRFDGLEKPLKMPHMGWNDLHHRKESPLFHDIHEGACFYFAHSYCVHCDDPEAILTATDYGDEFISSVHKDNIFGTQFHPEMSHANGRQLIRNFLAYNGLGYTHA